MMVKYSNKKMEGMCEDITLISVYLSWYTVKELVQTGSLDCF